MALEELRLIDEQIGETGQGRWPVYSASTRMQSAAAEVPGLGVDSAQQIIAEVGPTSGRTFPSEKLPLSWVGACR